MVSEQSTVTFYQSPYFTISCWRRWSKSLSSAHQEMASSHLLWFSCQMSRGMLGLEENEGYTNYNLGRQTCLCAFPSASSCSCVSQWKAYSSGVCACLPLCGCVRTYIYTFVCVTRCVWLISNYTALYITDGANADASMMIFPTPVGARMIVWDLGRAGRQNEAQISLVSEGQWDWHAAV